MHAAAGISRRAVLASLLGTTALGLGVLSPPAGLAQQSTDTQAQLGFAGPDLLQISLQDGIIDKGMPQPVPAGARVQWTPRPTNRLGGLGRLDGVVVNFTGSAHTTASQLYRPFARVREGSEVPAFRGGGDGSAPADAPTAWRVEVDGAPVAVSAVFRKTVPTETARIDRSNRAATKRHHITLRLAEAVPADARVAVTGPGAAGQVVRSPATPSSAVVVCHEGYAIAAPKRGYAGAWLGQTARGTPGTTDTVLSDQTRWVLRDDTSGAEVLSGALTVAKSIDEPHVDALNFNGCTIFEADFSPVTAPGQYRLEVDGLGSSLPFPIAANPYHEVLRLAGRWYFHQRSGIAIGDPHGEGRTRPRNGHPADGLIVEQSAVRLGRTSEGFRREPYTPGVLGALPSLPPAPNAWGGWHDAGDWDRRPQHMEAVHSITVGIELFPSARLLNLNIPESGRPFSDAAVAARRDEADRGDGTTVLPDLIHEALWGLSLWRRTQRADGGIIGGVEYSLDGIEGSVSWNPVQRCFALAPEEWAAYHFVNAAAKLGDVITRVCGDAVLGAQLIREAVAAWDWAEGELATAQRDATLAPRDATAIARTRVKAAASLCRTGHTGAQEVFETINPFLPRDPEAAQGIRRHDLILHAMDYVRAGQNGVLEVDQELAERITAWAGRRINADQPMGRDFGLHNTALYPWGTGWLRFGPGSNWRARRLVLDYMLTGSTERIGDQVVEGMWFALGCNPSNVSLIQGLGHRAIADPLTKDLDGFGPVPGQPSFGVAGGELRPFERRRLAGAMYPADQAAWPIYTQIFESSAAIISTEHGMRSNAMEWLFACMLCNEHLSRQA